ncbi:hypothetical protein Neosp_008962 [[Neocosmospora] mangrovei]
MAEPHAVHKLMAWGCLTGNMWAIKKALSLGAGISTVEVAWRNDGTAILASTIGLAANRFNYDIFEFLLKSGAQPDVPIHITQSAAFKRRLFTPQIPRFVELCQEYGVKDRIPDIQANLDATLVEAVKLNLKLKICQDWMDLGANPTGRVGKSWNPETALSLAILSGSITVAKAMVSRGWHIMHTTFGWVSEPPDPCPPELFTKFYDISHPLMIQKLLSKGASINETSLALPDGEVADQERLLWNPTAGALLDIPDRLDPQEREELRRQRKDAEELFDQQAAQESAEQRPRGLESFITGDIW